MKLIKKLIKKYIYSLTFFFLNREERKIIKKCENQLINSLEHKEHIKLAAEWLLLSQNQNTDKGYSRSYCLLNKRWDTSYIETTGYIIPTLIDTYKYSKQIEYLNSALNAAEWLLDVQDKSGGFSGVEKNQGILAFDTGQCLYGLISAYNNTGDEKYLKAIIKASDYLVNSIETDGYWLKNSYNEIPHTYYSRVSSALYEAYLITRNKIYKDISEKNIHWTIKQQNENGYFNFCEFDPDTPAVLHTIIYVLEGLLHYYQISGNQLALNSTILTAEKLLTLEKSNQIMFLSSQFDKSFNPINKDDYCLTGLAQWSCICFDLFKITKDSRFLDSANKNISFLKSKQILLGNNLIGSLPSSIPIDGHYLPYKITNWTIKFYLDALIRQHSFQTTDKTHEEAILRATSFNMLKDQMPKDLSSTDKFTLKRIESFITNEYTKCKILDVGAGTGKYIEKLEKLRHVEIIGIDPTFQSKSIIKGSFYNIPFPKSHFDIVLCNEVLQHSSFLKKSLKEVRRVLKSDGIIFLKDRSPNSIIGILKKYYEKNGKWMYPRYSNIKENWYSKHEWYSILKETGFKVCFYETFSLPHKKIPFFHRYFHLIGKNDKRD